MKSPGLVLAAILALVAAAPDAQKYRDLMRILNNTYDRGSYTPFLRSFGHPEEAIFNRTEALIIPALESSKLLEPRLEPRTRREAVALRRGRMKAGTRPVCRGCYSGLMIVAPPGQPSKNASWNESQSHSESEGQSSEGD